ncbi:RNA-binding S4 domain-containing protein [Agarilytica rhodophyticola]|uniref:RNA-binding S4 domain-containing protein n=1 Tax=Agarilytica rhodophyticola TaxID=1737490 RepID=UPI000B3451F8|nr:S4 domain-containing protein [Agarilytica rhodophyticola]
MSDSPTKLRIDKWLWAARFFKTRSIAKHAIEGGKVRLDGNRIKSSKEVEVGNVLTIRQGWDEKTVRICGLSEQRKGAPEAQKLYQETQESLEQREKRTEERKAFGATAQTPTKPNTKERRQLQRIKREILDE